jgi:hypothetical protein
MRVFTPAMSRIPPSELGREGRVAQDARETQRREELRGPGQREDEVLEQCVGNEHRAQGKAQHQGCGGGIARFVHGDSREVVRQGRRDGTKHEPCSIGDKEALD